MNPKSPAKKLLQYFFPWRGQELVERLADEIALQCKADLWQRISPEVGEMGIAEARGYAGALAVGYVESEMSRTPSCHELNPALRMGVLRLAADKLVGMSVRELLLTDFSADPEILAA